VDIAHPTRKRRGRKRKQMVGHANALLSECKRIIKSVDDLLTPQKNA